MGATAHLHEPLAEYGSVLECDAVEIRGTVVWLEPVDAADHVIVPLENLAGVSGPAVDREVEQTPTQGGQYTEVVTRVG